MTSPEREPIRKSAGTPPPPPTGRRIGVVKLVLFVLAVVVLLAVTTLRFFAPEKYYALEGQWKFYRAGVKPLEFRGLHGIDRNLCGEVEAKDGNGCHCVLFVHGIGDSSLTWRKIFLTKKDKFSEPVRLVAFDLPGTGKSPLPTDRSALQVSELGRVFSQWIHQSDCLKTTVVGNSFGGWVALWTVIHDAASVSPSPKVSRILSFAGTGFKGVKAEDDFLDRLRDDPTIEGLKEFQRRAYYHPILYPENFWEQALKRARESKSTELSSAQNDEQYLNGRKWIDFPKAEYYWGEADRIVPREMGERFARTIPGAEFFLLSKCGHLPQKECPDVVFDAIFGTK